MIIGSKMKKGFTIFLIPEATGLPSMQFRISFASIVSGSIVVGILITVFVLMILDLNTAADDGEMHSENLRIRKELDSMHIETRELQRQIELLQAYSLHIDISSEELDANISNQNASNKDERNKDERNNSEKSPSSTIQKQIIKNQDEKKQEASKSQSSSPNIYIDVQPDPDSEKKEIFIDVGTEKNPSKKKISCLQMKEWELHLK